MRRITITLFAAFALGLGLAGCSSSDDSGTVTGETIPGVITPTGDTGTETGDDNGGTGEVETGDDNGGSSTGG